MAPRETDGSTCPVWTRRCRALGAVRGPLLGTPDDPIFGSSWAEGLSDAGEQLQRAELAIDRPDIGWAAQRLLGLARARDGPSGPGQHAGWSRDAAEGRDPTIGRAALAAVLAQWGIKGTERCWVSPEREGDQTRRCLVRSRGYRAGNGRWAVRCGKDSEGENPMSGVRHETRPPRSARRKPLGS